MYYKITNLSNVHSTAHLNLQIICIKIYKYYISRKCARTHVFLSWCQWTNCALGPGRTRAHAHTHQTNEHTHTHTHTLTNHTHQRGWCQKKRTVIHFFFLFFFFSFTIPKNINGFYSWLNYFSSKSLKVQFFSSIKGNECGFIGKLCNYKNIFFLMKIIMYLPVNK